MTTTTRMTIMTYQFLTKKTVCTTVRQHHYKAYHPCCGIYHCTSPQQIPSSLWELEHPTHCGNFAVSAYIASHDD
eukprot:12925876-Prorocentrum_lima.AAC.1